MGPGYHAKIEKQFFSQKHPDILFWDQPQTQSFDELTSETLQKIEEIYNNSNTPVSLYAHSFGGQLAFYSLLKKPELIGKIVMLNSAADPFECFLNLSDADEATKAAIRKSTTSEKMQLLFSVAGRADFADLYWNSKEKKQKYDEVAKNFEELNTNTFVQVFSSFLESEYYKNLLSKKVAVPASWNKSVIIFRSTEDKLISKPSDCESWLTLLPSAKMIDIKNSGHYSLFDSSETAELFFK